jgi:predicted dienelactone hydrolase
MRLFELLIPIVLAVFLAWPLFSRRRPRWLKWLPTTALALALLHLALEGYRWQMIPLYLLVVALFLLSLGEILRPTAAPRARRAAAIAASLLGLGALILATALPFLLPVPNQPKPSGPYPVGTLNLHLVDPARQEQYAPASGAPEAGEPEGGRPRELMVQVWYPAAADSEGATAPWMQDMQVMGPAISQQIGMPPFFLGHVAYVRTHAILEAPLAPGGEAFPLLLFSHGWGGFRQQNSFQMQELASHGFVVAAVQHPYGAVATVFPDGRVAYNNPEALPVGAAQAEFLPAAWALADQWAGDLGFVLDYLSAQNAAGSGSPFSGRLDLDQVGVFGHSTGGGAAVEFCGREARCRAGLGLDAYLTPVSQAVLQAGLEQPFLFLYSELWPSEQNDRLLEQLFANSPVPLQAFTILGTDHYDFSDLPMLSPLSAQLGLKGPLNGARVLRIINDYSLDFFSHYLKGKTSDLLQGDTGSYPEVVDK